MPNVANAPSFGDLASIARQQIWEGVVARTIHGERVTMALIELAPNSHVPDHHHANEQMGVLIRGSMRMRIGEETRELGTGDTWRVLRNVPHEVDTGPDGALALEVWSPPREDWKELERDEPRAPGWPE
jgi:quercetin dioxygenase-like cupin family protein